MLVRCIWACICVATSWAEAKKIKRKENILYSYIVRIDRLINFKVHTDSIMAYTLVSHFLQCVGVFLFVLSLSLRVFLVFFFCLLAPALLCFISTCNSSCFLLFFLNAYREMCKRCHF